MYDNTHAYPNNLAGTAFRHRGGWIDERQDGFADPGIANRVRHGCQESPCQHSKLSPLLVRAQKERKLAVCCWSFHFASRKRVKQIRVSRRTNEHAASASSKREGCCLVNCFKREAMQHTDHKHPQIRRTACIMHANIGCIKALTSVFVQRRKQHCAGVRIVISYQI